MQLQINTARGTQHSDSLERFVKDSLGTVERRFGDMLTRVEVFLSDINGPKGGVNKQCKMEARPRGQDPVLAEGLAEDAYDAVSQTAKRLEKVLATRFGKLGRR